jgi:hypothetical protein
VSQHKFGPFIYISFEAACEIKTKQKNLENFSGSSPNYGLWSIQYTAYSQTQTGVTVTLILKLGPLPIFRIIPFGVCCHTKLERTGEWNKGSLAPPPPPPPNFFKG